MTLEYTLSPQDYLEYMQYTSRTDPSYKTRVNTYRVTLILLIFVLAYLLSNLFKLSGTGTLIAYAAAVPLCVLWFFLAPKRMQAAQKNAAQKLLQTRNISLFFAPRTLTLQQDGIHLNTKSSTITQSSLFTYASVARISRDAGRLYTYIEDALVIIIPFTAFANAEQHAAFEQMLQQYSGKPIITT